MCQQVILTLDSVVVCDKATHALWVLEIYHTITLRKIPIQFRFAQGCKLPTLALVEDVALLVHMVAELIRHVLSACWSWH